MFLILAEPADPVAGGVARHLPATSTVWLTPAQLVRATWTHSLDMSGCWFRVRVGARTLDSREVTATLNRLRWLPVGGFGSREDGQYAAMEWQALAISALAALGEPVINRPCPPSLTGPSWSAIEWVRAAGRLGLPVRRVRATTDGRRHPGHGDDAAGWRRWLEQDPQPAEEPRPHIPVGARPIVWVEPVTRARSCWVVGDDLLGDHLPGDPDARALSQAAACSLLRVDMAQRPDGSTMLTGADPFPDRVPEEVAVSCADVLRSWGSA